MNGQDCEQLTLFREDSLASRLVLPGSDEAQKMTVTSGQKCLELYKNSSPVGSLAKMLLESSTWRSTRCYLTWKISATPAKRLLFRLVPSMPSTGETDARLLPTPTTQETEHPKAELTDTGRRKTGNSSHSLNLADTARMWPTPRVGGSMGSSSSGVKHGDLGAVAALYPTPTTGAGVCGGTGNFQQLKRLKEQGQITEEERRNMSQGNGGQLNPTWVEWLMGFPIGWTDLNASETP